VFGAGSVFSFSAAGELKNLRFQAVETCRAETPQTGTRNRKSTATSLKIDAFTHIAPREYVTAAGKMTMIPPSLSDLDARFRSMDELGNILQLLTLGGSPVEAFANPNKAVDLSKACNDGMAALVAGYPDRFAGAAAYLPMGNMDAAMKELERAIEDLKLNGVLIYTSINDKPLDSPEFVPLFEKMAEYDLPIWIHPFSGTTKPYYPGEEKSKYNLAAIVGWPHATTMAMLRLAGSGLLERLPNLKLLTHHSGGTVPYLINRIEYSPFGYGRLTGSITDSLKRFYNDTAVQGNTANLMCAHALCGAGHMLFGTDFPMADAAMVKRIIHAIEKMEIPASEKRKIFSENARVLFRLER
jgi:aminocarboxymuconate-semialdehyde decarboxylase